MHSNCPGCNEEDEYPHLQVIRYCGPSEYLEGDLRVWLEKEKADIEIKAFLAAGLSFYLHNHFGHEPPYNIRVLQPLFN